MTLLSLVFLVTFFAIESYCSLESFCLCCCSIRHRAEHPSETKLPTHPIDPFVYTTHRIESEKTTTTAAARWLIEKGVFLFSQKEKAGSQLLSRFLLLFLHFLIERLAFFFPLLFPLSFHHFHSSYERDVFRQRK